MTIQGLVSMDNHRNREKSKPNKWRKIPSIIWEIEHIATIVVINGSGQKLSYATSTHDTLIGQQLPAELVGSGHSIFQKRNQYQHAIHR